MRILYFFSLSLVVATTLTMSCVNEDSGPQECDGSLAVMVESKSNPTTCTAADGSITVSAAGGKSPYLFSINGGLSQASQTFSDLTPGSYLIKVTDASNCEHVIENVVIEVPGTTLSFSAVTPTADTDCTSNNGAITATGTGGITTSPYQFALNDGTFSASNSFSGLAPGTYTVKIKDAGGCIVTQSVQVLQGVTGVTYSNNILPIFNAKCAFSGCHPNNGDWFNYNTAKNKATAIKTRTGNGTMPRNATGTNSPPGGALTATEIALIACWVDDGAPQ